MLARISFFKIPKICKSSRFLIAVFLLSSVTASVSAHSGTSRSRSHTRSTEPSARCASWENKNGNKRKSNTQSIISTQFISTQSIPTHNRA
jgi:hypothetical protein